MDALAPPCTAPRVQRSHSLSLSRFHDEQGVVVKTTRDGHGVKRKAKYQQLAAVLRERDAAERVVADFYELAKLDDEDEDDDGVGGVVLRVGGAEVCVRSLCELALDQEYVTLAGNSLVRVSPFEVRLGRIALPVDPDRVRRNTALFAYLTQPARDRDLAQVTKELLGKVPRARKGRQAPEHLDEDPAAPGAGGAADEDDEPEVQNDMLQYARYLLARLAKFCTVRLKESLAESKREDALRGTEFREESAIGVDLSSGVSTVDSVVAGVSVVVDHEDPVAKFESLKAPPGTTHSASLSFLVRPKVKKFKIGTLSGNVKAVMSYLRPKIKALFPSFLDYASELVTDEQGRRIYRVSAFFDGDVYISSEASSFLQQLEVALSFGRTGVDEEEEDGAPAAERVNFLPPKERIAAAVRFRCLVDELLVSWFKKMASGTWLHEHAVQWADIAYLVRQLSVRLDFKDSRQLLEHHSIGEPFALHYDQSRDLVHSMLATLEEKIEIGIGKSLAFVPPESAEQLKTLYTKFLKSARLCLAEFDSVQVQYASLSFKLGFQGLRLFDVLPTMERVMEVREAQLAREELLARGQGDGDARGNRFSEEEWADLRDTAWQDADESPDWSPVSDSAVAKVWMKKSENSAEPYMLKVLGILEGVSAQQAFEQFYDVPIRDSWDEYITEHVLLEDLPELSSQVVSTRYWVPPFVDHRVLVEYRTLRQEEGTYYLLARGCNHPDAVERKGHVYGHIYYSGYVLKDVGTPEQPRCRAVAFHKADYGGSLPRSLTNFMNKFTFRDWMGCFIERCKDVYVRGGAAAAAAAAAPAGAGAQ